MGWSVQLAVEVRRGGDVEHGGPDGARWERVEEVLESRAPGGEVHLERARWFDERCYAIFGALAGVRGRGPVIAPVRGVPVDAAEETLEVAAGPDMHTHGWLTLAELVGHDWDAVEAELVGEGRERTWERFVTLLVRMREAAGAGTVDDVRMVFCFDS